MKNLLEKVRFPATLIPMFLALFAVEASYFAHAYIVEFWFCGAEVALGILGGIWSVWSSKRYRARRGY